LLRKGCRGACELYRIPRFSSRLHSTIYRFASSTFLRQLTWTCEQMFTWKENRYITLFNRLMINRWCRFKVLNAWLHFLFYISFSLSNIEFRFDAFAMLREKSRENHGFQEDLWSLTVLWPATNSSFRHPVCLLQNNAPRHRPLAKRFTWSFVSGRSRLSFETSEKFQQNARRTYKCV